MIWKNAPSLWNVYMKLKHEPRSFLYQFPVTFILLASLNFKKKHVLLGQHTEIVIEGFPRSGNTFAHVAFEYAQQRPIAIASHFHAPGQIIWAIRKNIPVLTIIRQPLESIPSSLIFEPYLSINQVIRSYLRFYAALIPYLDEMVVAEFNEITHDFGQVIRKINDFYDTSFIIFEHTPQNVQTCFEKIDEIDRTYNNRPEVTDVTVARPSENRQEKKKIILEELKKEKYRRLINHAQGLYQQYINHIN